MNNHQLVLLNCLEQQIEQVIARLEQAGLEDLSTLKENHSTLLDDNLTLKHQSLKD
jgi:hypothetical protein